MIISDQIPSTLSENPNLSPTDLTVSARNLAALEPLSALNLAAREPLNILLFDCRDSFTHNLAQLINEMSAPRDCLTICRPEEINLSQMAGFNRVVLSPGPGLPEETENLLPLIRLLAPNTPILGVCLGHQALALAFGGRLLNLKKVYHGLASKVIILEPDYLFEGLPPEILAGRYHSWLVDSDNFPQELMVTAVDDTGQIMGLAHREYNVRGVQFHPESILTPMGPRLLRNFLVGPAKRE